MTLESTDAFRVLASADRQYVLHELLERDGESTVGELSRRVALRRHRTAASSDTVTAAEVERARVRLVHIHFPQLLQQDVIEVDWADNEVTLAESDDVDVLFEAAEELDEWPPEPKSKLRHSW